MDIRYCPRCGEHVEPEDSFCFECGAELAPSGGAASMRTVWAGAIVSVLGIFENGLPILFAEQVIEQLEQSGFGGEVTEATITATGTVGVLLSLTVLGVSYYYYREDRVARRYLWGLVVAGLVGILFTIGFFSFLLLLGIGAYGLLFGD